MYRSVSQCGDGEDEKRDEGKRITEALSKLKYELQHGRALTYVGEKRGGEGEGAGGRRDDGRC
jgi:hypothetical protein